MDIADASAYFFEACCLAEDPAIDPEDHVAVIEAALLTSDCDDFAWVMSRVISWPAVTLMWNMGNCLTGHHSLVRSPDGRLLDITGYTDEASVARRFGIERKSVTECEFRHFPFNFTEHSDDECLDALLSAGIGLCRAPFTETWFVEALERYRKGLEADVESDVHPSP